MATLFLLNIIFSIIIIVLYRQMTFIESCCWIVTTVIESIIILTSWYLCQKYQVFPMILQYFNWDQSITSNTFQRHSQRYVANPDMEKECTIYFSKFNLNNIYKLPGKENKLDCKTAINKAELNRKKSIDDMIKGKIMEQNSSNFLKQNLRSSKISKIQIAFIHLKI